MKAGELRHRVTLQSYDVTRDEFGAEVPGWVDLATVWASVEDLTGKEYFAAQQVNAEASTRVKIRYRGDVKSQMRLIFGDRTLNIEAALNPDGRKKELLLMCKEVVA